MWRWEDVHVRWEDRHVEVGGCMGMWRWEDVHVRVCVCMWGWMCMCEDGQRVCACGDGRMACEVGGCACGGGRMGMWRWGDGHVEVGRWACGGGEMGMWRWGMGMCGNVSYSSQISATVSGTTFMYPRPCQWLVQFPQ